MAPKPDPWVRLFDVRDPARHKKGYTVYKVISTVYPRSAPEAVTQIVVWKRYNDFKNLHKSLQILHTKLYLKGVFPPFAKARLFGRFDASVIEERRQSAYALLEFVAQHPPLFTSQLFVKFFESGQKITPSKLIRDPAESPDVFDVLVVAPPLESLVERPAEANSRLGGIWQYPRESVSSSSDSSTDERTTTDGDGDSVRSAASTVELFDPCRGVDADRFVDNNVWLLATMANCGKTDEERLELDPSLSVNLNTKAELDPSPPSVPPPQSPAPSMDESDYIVSAADAISKAQLNEADGNYEISFMFYKRSVQILLEGVRGDSDGARRDAVRKKTAQYLSRAEEIYRKYLVCNGDLHDVPSRDASVNGAIGSLLQSPLSELKNYKVLGVIDKILLVLDVATQNTFVMKILHKTSSPSDPYATSVVPSKIRFMVQLYKFVESDYAIFLVQEHATGGRLWNYVRSYLVNNSPHDSRSTIHADQAPTNDRNVYSGKKLLVPRADDSVAADTTTDDLKTDPADDVDSDLVAKGECASSYVNLFTSYAASLAGGAGAGDSDADVGLAKCHLAATASDSDRRFEELESQRRDVHFPEDLDELVGPVEQNGGVDLNRVTTLEDLGRLGADDLIECAHKLMTTVDRTLLRAAAKREISDDDDDNAKTSSPPPTERFKEKKAGGRRRRSRPMSDDDVFASPQHQRHHELRRSLSAGSLAPGGARRPRLRHLSAAFDQLDSANSSKNARLPESCIRVWAAEMIVAVWQLHSLGIVCRDLCPDNVLLGSRGHILLTYFGQWANVERTVRPSALENMYAAPELNGIEVATPACDWWSVGALLFELITGRTLISCHPGGVTSHSQLNIPPHISAEARSLLVEFLRFAPNERLGAGANGMEAIKTHSFFHNINWDQIIYEHT